MGKDARRLRERSRTSAERARSLEGPIRSSGT
jgi:hypothetical protein